MSVHQTSVRRSKLWYKIVVLATVAGVVGLIWYLLSRADNGYVPVVREKRIWAPDFNPQTVLLSPTIRSSVSFSTYSVIDAFPGVAGLSGAMQIRPYPGHEDRWLVATFTGKLIDIELRDQAYHVRTVLDIDGDDHGWLYSFALHPQFSAGDESNQRVFVFYRNRDTELVQYYRVSFFDLPVSRPAGVADERVLIEQRIAHLDHLGEALDFDTDGFLLISVGDNGRAHDDSQNSQKIDGGLFSGVLRIDPDRRTDGSSFPPTSKPRGARTAGYHIPVDNPFIRVRNANQEFWSIGLRSPFRMSVDHQTGQTWIGEVGQDRYEQIELAGNGTNHYWSYREGSKDYTQSYLLGSPPLNLHGRATEPYFEYEHADQNYCIVGGVVYRSDRFPELNNRYLFGDNQSGRVWSICLDNPSDRRFLLQLPTGKQNSSLTSIATDSSGRIFFTHFAAGNQGTSVHELTRRDQPSWPEQMSDWPFFDGIRSHSTPDGFVAYDVNSPLWSDGLQKARYLSIPPGQVILNSRSEWNAWQFPAGTKFVKHFYTSRPIETRILVISEGGEIYGATYVWDEGGTNATLSLDRRNIILPVPETAIHDQPAMDYVIPSNQDCLVCHNSDHPVLGVNALQLNRLAASDSKQNQLVNLSLSGMLKFPYEEQDVDGLARLCDPSDKTHGLESRARSYLHANCSFCHYPHGTQRTEFDARISVALEATRMIQTKAKTGYLSIDGRRPSHVITSGDPESSAIYRRLLTRDRELVMPYLGRSTTDRAGSALIEQWILEMRP